MFLKLSTCLLIMTLAGCNNSNNNNTDDTLSVPVVLLEEERTALRSNIVDAVISPAYDELLNKAQSLQQQALNGCNANTGQLSNELLLAWQQTALAWQHISWLDFGPIENNFTAFKIQFYPDNNNAVQRGVDLLISQGSSISASSVASANAGAQGIPALEYLLYGLNANANHCRIIEAISNNLLSLISPLQQGWAINGQTRNDWLTLSGDFLNADGQMIELELLTSALSTMVIINSDAKLLNPINNGIERLESRWAGLSKEWLTANTHGINTAFYGADGYGIDDYLIRWLESPTTVESWQTNIDNIQQQQELVNESFNRLISQQDLNTLENLEDSYQALDDFISQTLVAILQVFIGFNNTDGD